MVRNLSSITVPSAALVCCGLPNVFPLDTILRLLPFFDAYFDISWSQPVNINICIYMFQSEQKNDQGGLIMYFIRPFPFYLVRQEASGIYITCATLYNFGLCLKDSKHFIMPATDADIHVLR